MRGPVAWARDPWRKPRVLQLATWGYLAWSLVPVSRSIRLASSASAFSMRRLPM